VEEADVEAPVQQALGQPFGTSFCTLSSTPGNRSPKTRTAAPNFSDMRVDPLDAVVAGYTDAVVAVRDEVEAADLVKAHGR
jgi:hypothetical protein